MKSDYLGKESSHCSKFTQEFGLDISLIPYVCINPIHRPSLRNKCGWASQFYCRAPLFVETFSICEIRESFFPSHLQTRNSLFYNYHLIRSLSTEQTTTANPIDALLCFGKFADDSCCMAALFSSLITCTSTLAASVTLFPIGKQL